MEIVTGDISSSDKKLLATITGELVQPVRIYYRMRDKDAIKQVFSKLKCIDFDSKRDRYVWLYQKEAKKLVFKHPYSSIPSKLRPIVIGSFFSKKSDEVYLETRSIERAIEGILFFETYIKKYMAEVEDISIINKVFSPKENQMDFSDFFDKAVAITNEERMKKIKSSLLDGTLIGKELLPEVERFPSHFHEDGILPLKFSLQGRQYVAIQHWQGNSDYTLADYISEVVSRPSNTKAVPRSVGSSQP
jgi:hypothetical protein